MVASLRRVGIRGYTNDYSMDYSCMEALQGSAIPKLMSVLRTWILK